MLGYGANRRKAPVKSWPPTNQHPASHPSHRPTNSVRAEKEILSAAYCIYIINERINERVNISPRNILEKVGVVFWSKRERFISHVPVVVVSGVNTAQLNVLKPTYTQRERYTNINNKALRRNMYTPDTGCTQSVIVTEKILTSRK